MRKPGIAGFVKRHLGLFGAVFLHSPYLHQTRAYGIEPDIFSARGIFGTIVQSFCCRQLSFFSSFNWNNVNVIIAFPVGTIGKLPSIRAPSVYKPGCKAEYQKRHAEIWPEMVKVLKDAGICNYSIFYCNDELFGYYECEKGVAYAEKVQAESPVVDRWNEYMKDILELEMDPVTGAQPKLEQVFRLD